MLEPKTFKTRVAKAADDLIKPFGIRLVQDVNLYDWQKPHANRSMGRDASSLPPGAADYLTNDNARLRELKEKYALFNSEVTTPLLWTEDHLGTEDLLYFRGDNAYVWQTRAMRMNIMTYALTTYYLKTADKLNLFDKLTEDDRFGVHYFSINDRLVSRDLLDSICEINFLDRYLGIASQANLSVVDIGAGYGRLAHRMTSALPNIKQYLCTDAVPASTFISEYYLRFRKAEEKAKVVPLFDIESVLQTSNIDLAVNIHSFSECKLPAIKWWLSRLADAKVKYLMVVPNPPILLTSEGINFGPVIEGYGYKLIASDPKYLDPVLQGYGINPSYYYLFSLT